MLEVYLFGRLSLVLDGRPLELPTHPARLLLAYLVLHAGVPQSREALADRFWPDSTAANARSNLRHTLWRLRQTLDPARSDDAPDATIVCRGEFVEFNPAAPFALDVARLDARRPLWSVDDLLAAVEAYQGELLPGYYEPWVVLERERLAAVYDRRMEQLLEALISAGRWEEVLAWSERWIAQGNTPEPAYRAMMQAHAARGDLVKVALAYHHCREALSAELAVDPSPQTVRLATGLLGVRSTPPPAAIPDPSPSNANSALAAALAQADVERRRAELYLGQTKRLNRLAAGLALGLAAVTGVAVALGRRR